MSSWRRRRTTCLSSRRDGEVNGPSHNRLVTLALQSLSSCEGGPCRHFADGMYETCMLPDAQAIPLLRGEGGSWRKYLPPVVPPFNFQIPGRRARAFFPPLKFFIRNVAGSLRRGDAAEAGRFAGVFSHFLGDFSEPAHYYELDIGRLLPPPAHMTNCNFHVMIESIESTVRSLQHRPGLLGTSLAEVEFVLESRLAALHGRSVAAVVPMARAIYARKNRNASKVFNGVMRESAEVLADFCHAAHCVARGKFPPAQVAGLRVFDLRRAEPEVCDVEFNFGQRPLVDSITRKTCGRAEPLRLYRRRGRRKVAEEVAGICVIPHALPVAGVTFSATLMYRLPEGTYATLETTVGLLAGESRQAACRFEVTADNRRLYRSRQFKPGEVAERLVLDLNGCRELGLAVYTDGSTDKLAYPIWGEPRLIKSL